MNKDDELKLAAELSVLPTLVITRLSNYITKADEKNIKLREEVIALRRLCNSVVNNTTRSGPHILQTLREGLAKLESSI